MFRMALYKFLILYKVRKLFCHLLHTKSGISGGGLKLGSHLSQAHISKNYFLIFLFLQCPCVHEFHLHSHIFWDQVLFEHILFWYIPFLQLLSFSGTTICILLFLSIDCFKLLAYYVRLCLYSSYLTSFVFCINFLNFLFFNFCSYCFVLFCFNLYCFVLIVLTLLFYWGNFRFLVF